MDKHDLIRKVIRFQDNINQMIMEYSSESWLSLDLTIAQLKSLIFICNREQTNFRELSRALDVTPSVVTGIVDRLVLHGMVNRTSSVEDRRIQWLTVTDKGKGILENIRQKNIGEITQILESLSHEDLSSLVNGFSALLKAAEEYARTNRKVLNNRVNED